MFPESALLPISALQHLLFCERQCALIHLEQAWADNVLTVEGSHLHTKAHDANAGESRGDVYIARSLALHSLRLGLSGQADVVEFHRDESGVPLHSRPGRWRAFPVEYKRGKPKRNHCDEVQLCAQALCLEEMLGTVVAEGALFYGETRRRVDVKFDSFLRGETEQAAARLHELLNSGITPPAVREPKCESCSLERICLPDALEKRRSASGYLSALVLEAQTALKREGTQP